SPRSSHRERRKGLSAAAQCDGRQLQARPRRLPVVGRHAAGRPQDRLTDEAAMNVNVPPGAIPNAALPREWPEGALTRIPFWIYQSPDIYALEQQRIFEGPVWNYLCLEAEVAKPGDYRVTFVGSMPVIVARDV